MGNPREEVVGAKTGLGEGIVPRAMAVSSSGVMRDARSAPFSLAASFSRQEAPSPTSTLPPPEREDDTAITPPVSPSSPCSPPAAFSPTPHVSTAPQAARSSHSPDDERLHASPPTAAHTAAHMAAAVAADRLRARGAPALAAARVAAQEAGALAAAVAAGRERDKALLFAMDGAGMGAGRGVWFGGAAEHVMHRNRHRQRRVDPPPATPPPTSSTAGSGTTIPFAPDWMATFDGQGPDKDGGNSGSEGRSWWGCFWQGLKWWSGPTTIVIWCGSPVLFVWLALRHLDDKGCVGVCCLSLWIVFVGNEYRRDIEREWRDRRKNGVVRILAFGMVYQTVVFCILVSTIVIALALAAALRLPSFLALADSATSKAAENIPSPSSGQ
ncbi:hypothetical protein IAT38_005812 [Cryptococcus sp. DSM 104549]